MMRPFFLTEFWRDIKGRESGIHVSRMLAFASMTSPPSRHTRVCGYPGQRDLILAGRQGQ